MIDFIQSLSPGQYMLLVAILTMLTGIMVIREILKLVMIAGAASGGKPVTFFPSYWVHLGATLLLVTTFVCVVIAR
jgi:hypothetical protein